MIRTASKGVFAHKLRLALTALAIVMGVSFVSGTFVLSDTINARFTTLFTDVYAGVDATVRTAENDLNDELGAFDAALLETVRAADGVDTAVGGVSGVAQIINPDGEPIGGQGPPTIGVSWVDVPDLSPIRIDDGNGRAPQTGGEVVIDVATATNNNFQIGDIVSIETQAGAEDFELVGLASFGTEDNLAGATMAAFELGEAQRLLGLNGQLNEISVLAAAGVSSDDLTSTLNQILPQELEAVTGADLAQESIDDINEGIGFITTALLAFAGVAVFVGAFIIQNTFRITVAQRTKELAMMRALGASRRQVTRMVLAEALVVGTLASAVGVAAGIGFAQLLSAGMSALGMGLPAGILTIATRTIVVGMTVGIVVTVVSALLPARKASRVAPIAAMRDSVPAPRSLRRRTAAGLTLTTAGGGLLAAGLIGDGANPLAMVGLGALLGFLGISTLAPLFARPVSRLLGAPLRGVTGRLARGNTARQPRRTASTASALMVGVALIAFVSIFATSIKASMEDTVEAAYPADLAFQSSNLTGAVSPQALEQIGELAEFDTVSAIYTGSIRLDGAVTTVAAVDPDTIGRVFTPETSIPWAEFDGGVLVREGTLESKAWAIGTMLDVEYPSGVSDRIEIAGTFDDQPFGDYLVTTGTYNEHYADPTIPLALARLADGVNTPQGLAAAEAALAAFPSIKIETASEQVAAAQAQIDQMLMLFSGLLGLAVIIAVIGIANTLALSVVERTREIGLLRAVGLSRRQVRRMVRWEAIITALFGALLGIGVGIGLGWAVVTALASEGLGAVTIPSGQLLAWLILAAVAGVIAAIGPARKASRMKVLDAIAYE
jgi:putative ABC transport system permease protein